MKKKLATLCTLLGSSLILSCGSSPVRDSESSLTPPPYMEDGFENNNNSISQDVLDEARLLAEQVRIVGKYRFTNGADEEEIREVGGSCSGIILDDFNALTAYHCTTLPQNINVYSLPTLAETYPHLDLSPRDLLQFIGGGYVAELISEPMISIGDMKDVKVLCPKYAEDDTWPYEGADYALLSFPTSGKDFYSLAESEHVHLGDSDVLTPGDYIYAIGYSLAQGRFVTDGIVSNVDEFLEDSSIVEDFPDTVLMISTPISGGNSGGPAFAAFEGELYYIGITIGHFTRGQNMNIVEGITDTLNDIEESYGINLREPIVYVFDDKSSPEPVPDLLEE